MTEQTPEDLTADECSLAVFALRQIRDAKVAEWNKRSTPALRNHYYERAERLQHRIDEWAKKKLAFDAARPDFTREQWRDLEAQEALLLALSSPSPATEER